MARQHRFDASNVARQFLGALLLGGGLIIPGDIWLVAGGMDPPQTALTVVTVVGLTSLAMYGADDRDVEREPSLLGVPYRLLSLLAISLVTTAAVALVFHVPQDFAADLETTINAIVVTGVFASLAGTFADRT